MSTNTLIQKIKADAATTVAEIKTAGSERVKSIQRETEKVVSSLKKNHAEESVKKQAHAELVAVSKAKQSGKIALQTAKRVGIDKLFEEVIEDITKLPEKDYVAFFEKHVKEILPTGVEVKHVHGPANRSNETAEILKNLGLEGEVRVDSEMKAGMVVRAKDGLYDITLERLMSEKRAELEMEILTEVMA